MMKDDTVYLGASYYLPKKAISSEEMERLLDDLTFRSPQSFFSGGGGEDLIFRLWRETDTHVLVPRHYSWRWIKELELATILKRPVRKGNPIPTKIILRDQVQTTAFEALVSTDEDKLISLYCGAGKTVISLSAASAKNKAPVLVVVRTKVLYTQWKERIEEFFPEEKGKVGKIQGPPNKWVWKGRNFVVGMIQTLVKQQNTLPKELTEYFNLVIFDECHALGAFSFSQVADVFPCERWGLSATMNRTDRMDQIFRLHLGKVKYEMLEQKYTPKVVLLETNIKVNPLSFRNRFSQVDTVKLKSYLLDHPQRTQLIIKQIKDAYARKREVLLLTERLSQIEYISSLLKKEEVPHSLLVGGLKENEQAEALKSPVILATSQFAREGLDKDSLNVLIMTLPTGNANNLQQSVGRILRKNLQPIVVVFVDPEIPYFRRKTQTMISIFERRFGINQTSRFRVA